MSARLSTHAEHRMREMRLRRADLEPVICDPEVVYGSNGQQNRQRDDLTVVLDITQDPPVVVTVLWRDTEQWDRRTYNRKGR